MIFNLYILYSMCVVVYWKYILSLLYFFRNPHPILQINFDFDIHNYGTHWIKLLLPAENCIILIKSKKKQIWRSTKHGFKESTKIKNCSSTWLGWDVNKLLIWKSLICFGDITKKSKNVKQIECFPLL